MACYYAVRNTKGERRLRNDRRARFWNKREKQIGFFAIWLSEKREKKQKMMGFVQ